MKKLEMFKNNSSEKEILNDFMLTKLTGGIGGGPNLTFSSCFETTCSGDNADQYYEFVDDNGSFLVQETLVLQDTLCIDKILQ